MGVWYCEIDSCRAVMPDTYIENLNIFICEDCQQIFKSWALSKGLHIENVEDMEWALEKFINRRPYHYNNCSVDIDEYFRARTKKS